MANNDKTYSSIQSPYDNLMNRGDTIPSTNVGDVLSSADSESVTTGGSSGSGSSGGGTVEDVEANTIDGTSLGDIFFDTFIKSRNYQPKVQGIYLDGGTGYGEFQTGNIAGWDFVKGQLSSGSVYIQSDTERILMGVATAPLTGIGIFMGLDSPDYEFRAGDPDNDYIHWDGSSLTIVGSISATTGSIGGWTISSNAIYLDGATDANSSGMTSADYPFYAGKKYVDRATAPFRVTPDGALVATSATITGTVNISNPGDIDGSTITNDSGWTDDTAADNAQTAANDAQGDANTALSKLDDIASDSKITSVEKLTLKPIWDSILAEKTSIDTQADTYSVSKVAYGTAYDDLYGYIVTSLDTFSNMTTTTDIIRATWDTDFEAYYGAKVDILNAIADATAVLADWTGISNIPGTLAAPSGAGLYLSSTYLGYYDSSNWKTYMDSSGNFYLGGSSGDLQWNGTTLSITGVITVSATSSGIGSFSDGGNLVTMDEDEIDQTNLINSADAGADVTQTIIDGGLITTGYITLGVSGNIKSGQTAYDTGTGFWLGNDGGTPKFSIGVQAGNKMTWDGSALTINGSVITSPTITGIQSGSEIAIQGWQSTLVLASSDYRTVGWSSGNDETIILLDGTVYTISSGNTGNMAALTYIYLDIAVSTTVLQTTTTASTAVGTGKILIGVAQNNSDVSSSATFQVYGGSGGQLMTVDNIAANSASTNEFISNTAQIKDAIITNAKISTLAVSKLTAGTITSKDIVLAVAAGTGDSAIRAGKSDFTNTDAGFILGLDDSDSDLPKFYIGDATTYLNWTGAALSIKGSVTITGGSGIASLTDAGDLVTVNEADVNTSNITNGAGWTDDTTADLRITTFIQSAIPTSLAAGDLWIDTDDGKMYRATGIGDTTIEAGKWIRVDLGLYPGLIDVLSTTNAPAVAGATDDTAADAAQGTANIRVTTFFQAGIPTSLAAGDIWFDTDDKNKMYRATGIGDDQITAGEWVIARDTDIAQAISDASGAQGTADGKVTTFYVATAPTATAIGDLWIDTDDGNKLYRASATGSANWVEVQDDDIASAISDAGTAQATADSKIVTFYQSGVPTATDVGDIWHDTDDGKTYRSTNIGDDQITAGEWERIDTGLYPALVDALQTTNAPAAAGADVTQTIIDGGIITTGYITLVTAGNIKSGQTAYETGNGFWLGNDGGIPKFSIGNSTDYLKWTGSAISLLCSGENAITIDYGSDILLKEGGDIKFTAVTVPTACTATLVTDAGNVDVGTHVYKVTYITSTGETGLGTASNTVTTDVTHKQVELSAIPVSTSGAVTGRKIYRTKTGGTNYYLLTTISDNTTTTYTDNIADASLTGEITNNKQNDTYGKFFNGSDAVIKFSGDNVALGIFVLNKNIVGYGNTGVGQSSLFNNTTGDLNTAVGRNSLGGNTTGKDNTVIGALAALSTETGSYNSIFGSNAGLGVDGNSFSNNCLFGYQTGIALTTGNSNTLIGYQAGKVITTGEENTSIGNNSGKNITTGSRNITIGHDTNYYKINDSLNIGNLIYGDLSTALLSEKFILINGLLFPIQAATASAPTYNKGAIYFDTTLNKLRIGGATGWETITSA